MLRLYSYLLMTVNALDRRLMRRASATSCGIMPSIMYRRNGFSQDRPSSVVRSVASIGWLLVSSTVLAAATCVGSFVSSSSADASGVVAFILIDLWMMLSRNTPGGTGPRV